MAKEKRPTLAEACAQYVHRFTMEHVPSWSRERSRSGYYAPQFRSDAEWYENTLFPGEEKHTALMGTHQAICYTTGQTWPLGQWLDKPYAR
jgi:hypothetical protein